jgi:Domain of unknown function (DUF927)/Bifunctional DNA primase/polymerase, N-terminal
LWRGCRPLLPNQEVNPDVGDGVPHLPTDAGLADEPKLCDFRTAAPALRTLGLHVMPLSRPDDTKEHPGKRPLVPGWQNRRFTDAEYEDWLNQPDFSHCNVGIPTGATPNGIVVLDVDDEAEFSQANLTLPKVWRVSPRNAYHIFFRHPDIRIKNNVKSIPGADIRGDGGQVVGVNSVHELGHIYQWDARTPKSRADFQDGLADMPAWLIRQGADPSDPNLEAVIQLAIWAESLEDKKHGDRNNTLNAIAFQVGKLIMGGLDEDLVRARFERAGRQCGLPESEIRTTLDSGIPAGIRTAEAEASNPVKFPFSLTDSHVIRSIKDCKGPADKVKVYTRLEIVAKGRDFTDRNWSRTLKVFYLGGTHEITLDNADMETGWPNYKATLMREGLEIGHGPKCSEYLKEYILLTEPKAMRRIVTRTGWQKEGVYALPGQVFGESGNERIIYQESKDHRFGTSGTLAEWQEQIGYCAGNSRLVFAVAAAFAAPLLYLMGEEGGGFHLYGEGSMGKTTAIEVAGSVWGGGERGYKRSWNTTGNAIAKTALAHNDALLCLDEISEVQGHLAEIAFQLTNGEGKARLTKDAVAKEVDHWLLLYLSTGNKTLADKIAEQAFKVSTAKETGGLGVRLLDIPADAGHGAGLFEDTHGMTGAEFARHLKAAAKVCYGVAARAWLEHLSGQPASGSENQVKGLSGPVYGQVSAGRCRWPGGAGGSEVCDRCRGRGAGP